MTTFLQWNIGASSLYESVYDASTFMQGLHAPTDDRYAACSGRIGVISSRGYDIVVRELRGAIDGMVRCFPYAKAVAMYLETGASSSSSSFTEAPFSGGGARVHEGVHHGRHHQPHFVWLSKSSSWKCFHNTKIDVLGRFTKYIQQP